MDYQFKKIAIKIKERSQQDFEKIYSQTNGEFIVISVDMQDKFLYNFPNLIKVKSLLLYHSEIKKYCKKYKIKYVEIKYDEPLKEKKFSRFFKNKNFIFFNKSGDSILSNPKIKEYLLSLKINNVYLIGVNRSACIFSSIDDLIKINFKIFTSIIGTGDSKEIHNEYQITSQNNVVDMKNIASYYKKKYENFGLNEFKFSNFLKSLIKKGVIIIDHNKK